jgi:hypothetical protein
MFGEKRRSEVTTKTFVAVFVELSVATTVWLPAVAIGMLKEQEKPPVDVEVAVHMVAAGVQLTVIPEPPAKPVPVTVSAVPTGPLVGESEIVETTVNSAVAVFEEWSVALIVWLPITAAGTVKVQTNVPFEWVVIEPWVQVTALRSNATVVAELPANPVPVTVSVLATAPLEAERTILGLTV